MIKKIIVSLAAMFISLILVILLLQFNGVRNPQPIASIVAVVIGFMAWNYMASRNKKE